MVVMNLTVFLTLLVFLSTAYTKDASDYRLPADHIPKKYDLKLIIDPDSDVFKGQVNITVSTKNETNTLKLHASPDFVTITTVKLNGSPVCNVSGVDSDTEIATIVCSTAIPISDSNKFVITFDGNFGNDPNGGFFKAHYEYDNKTEYFVASQFQTVYARQGFPCFDEPQLKAEFQVTVVHPNNYTALSNTRVSSTATKNQ